MKTLKVDLKERSYEIYLDSDNLSGMKANLRSNFSGKKVLVVTNQTILKLYQKDLTEILECFDFTIATIPDSEEAKSIQELDKLYFTAISAGLDRTSAIIAFGGGVVGDIAGFLAATLFRGITFIQIPTTLLAQVDSSVGGKVAINHPLGKNLIGAFYQPKAVLIDTKFLQTLPEREIKCGLAEVLKYALIMDKEFFEYLDSHVEEIFALDKEALENIIAISCNTKSKIVALDEKEENIRAILNFGHTLGHALEKNIGYGIIKHGEAVAIGMALALKIGHRLELLNNFDCQSMLNLIEKYRMPIEIPVGIDMEKLVAATLTDKKNENSTITLILATKIGKAIIKKGFKIREILRLLV